MTASDAIPPPAAYDTPDGPRRLVLADLVARFATATARQASRYEAAAGQAEGDLREALEGLARAKQLEVRDLAPLARALGAAPPPPPPPAASGTPHWGVILGEAFQAERVLEGLGRELTGLTADPGVKVLGSRLTAEVLRDREEVRKLYLRYS
jgi:hypothetical protein